ncbi:hypothetical protein [Tenacibaculum piscium]|uniref:Chloroplast import component protein (Tic20) n=1 Tax=Tenacibaculum piscium TaxID=1458515 RepID=A0A2H1YFT6_9FLAO|nr:hypothetical protein [Tenacibaculum piscium]MBE7629739.1 hypothetical protein [Tenacibaculum piscium]MBE7671532.1 hypothetical protein [Tenacibaculum piscium]MBE7685379.1 hypothetical protein [Tenacibaculum piscium]MBE7690655.1 hypothetical protein [Tenacibaculum piscium]MCG8182574.1 hypothetical protein [Tenacibaculum piscium]
MNNITISEGKTNAVISHFWIIGTIIAFVLNLNTKNQYTSFYIRQMTGLHILSFLNGWLVYKYLGSFIGWTIGISLFILWILSFIAVLKGEKKLIPIIGEYFQDWFKEI